MTAEFALTDLAAILGDKVVFLGRFLQIDSEAGDVRGRHQQVLQLAGAPPCKITDNRKTNTQCQTGRTYIPFFVQSVYSYLLEAALYADVLTGDGGGCGAGGRARLVGAARRADVRVALAHRHEARTLLGGALSLAAAAREAVST